MKPFKRTQRVADQIKRDAAEVIADLLRDQTDLLVTVSAVELASDLRNAKIFYTVLGEEPERLERVKAIFERSAGFIQSEIAHRLRLRRVPEMTFHFDRALVEGLRLTNLIDTVMSEQNDREH